MQSQYCQASSLRFMLLIRTDLHDCFCFLLPVAPLDNNGSRHGAGDSNEKHRTPPPPPPPPRLGNAMPAYVRLCQCVQCVFNSLLFFTHVHLCGCQVHGRRLIQRLQMTQLLILETLLLLLVEVTHVCMCHNICSIVCFRSCVTD